jgi:hypothetical protein
MDIRSAISAACLGASCLGVGWLASPAPVAAKSAFDGSWTVTARTTQGACDRLVHYRIVIIDGRVMSGDIRGVSGQVGASGSVTVRVQRDEGTAQGSGRLGPSSGSGRWTVRSSTKGNCAGEWSAERAG